MQHGPMDVGRFMALCLGHPVHGYYMKQDPFGASGDFTTAPEVSQMFGEMLGVWVCDLWTQMGSPDPFYLVECGPGRGTLMADLLRACGGVPGFVDACSLHMIEMSPVLKDLQAKALKPCDVRWHETLNSVPDDAPLFIIGNEFLDALPFRQLVKIENGWAERVIALEGDAFVFGLKSTALSTDIKAKTDDVIEVSPARSAFVSQGCDLIQRAGGAALFLDYGYVKSAAGDTFQALKGHEPISPLTHVGDADLTSHVDFEATGRAALDAGAQIFGPQEQGAFLRALGIDVRAQALLQKADDKQAQNIQSGLHRLTHCDEMGALFKVIGFTYDDRLHPAGFSKK